MNPAISVITARETWETEDRLIPTIRILLALSAQLILLIHPGESGHAAASVKAALGFYAVYGVSLLILVWRSDRFAANARAWSHWIDIGWCLALIVLSGGAGSFFFVGFLFPIMAASFYWGFASGLRIAIVSVLSYVAICFAPLHAPAAKSELPRLFLKSAWLFGIGYMMAHWGDSKIMLRRRLALLDEIIERSNPRFGIDRTIGSLLESLKRFYGAQSSLIVFSDSKGGEFRLQRTGERPEISAQPEPVVSELATRLLELSPECALVYNARSEGWWRLPRIFQLLDISLCRVTKVARLKFLGLALILDAKSFVTVPLWYRSEGIGRLYVVASKAVFVPSDMRFLLQVLERVNPIIENIRLVEQLASHAADEERRKIARDIHDSIIQPYLGLQAGLAAIHEKSGDHFPQLTVQIEKLMDVAERSIDDLRSYVTGVKKGEGSAGGLLPAMRRFAATFSEATGIAVQIETEGDIHANERLAAEAFQMMEEGLSNIRKHTQSLRARVRLTCRLGHLILEIANEGTQRVTAPLFTPASIAERAAALGGKVQVRSLPDGGTSVVVDIPL